MNAITTAGVTYAATQACSMGKLHQCGCANLPSGRNELDTNEAWVWGGCGDNVEYGYTKSKEFVDAHMKRRSDIGTLVTLHNNEAGRLVGIVIQLGYSPPPPTHTHVHTLL